MDKKIIGIDEAGRGAVAGPIVAAAVCIRDARGFPRISVKDSKLLTDTARRAILEGIIASCRIGYGVVSSRLIDSLGIQQANVMALELALRRVALWRSDIHSDYVGAFTRYACFDYPVELHINGESVIPEIAAASIAAKVYRDDILIQLDEQFPLYGFALHKGYGTSRHLRAIHTYGLTPAHRKSFLNL